MFPNRTAPAGQPARRPLRRALVLAGLLVAVWGGSHLLSLRPDVSEAATPVVNQGSSIRAGQATRTILSPGYVAALLLLAGGAGIAFYLRKRNGPAPVGEAALRSVGRLQLGPAQQVHLVACGETLLVLGATSSQISLLATLPRTTKSEGERGYRHSAHVRVPAAESATDLPFEALLQHFGSQRSSAASSNTLR